MKSNSSALNLIFALILVTFLVNFSEGLGLCPRLLPGKGVELQCSTYVSANKSEVARPCTQRSPVNTIARFNCKPYFTPANEQSTASFEKISRDGRGFMKCNQKGRWRNIRHYKQFKCHLSAGGWINQVVDTNRVVMFSLSYCGYCHKIKQIFQDMRVKYFAIELDLVDPKKASLLKDALWRKTGMKTYPNIFINRRHIGGYDKTYAAYYYGTLQELLDADPLLQHQH